MFTPSGCKDMIRKFEFVAKTQFFTLIQCGDCSLKKTTCVLCRNVLLPRNISVKLELNFNLRSTLSTSLSDPTPSFHP